MARIVGGLGTSHVPIIGRTIEAGKQSEVGFAPFFDAYGPVHQWLDKVKPDVAIVFYNDHGLNFALDNMPTFAMGVAGEYHNADEGWGEPEPRVFKGSDALSWHIVQSLIEDDFDISVCGEMLFDHAGTTALDLLYPGHNIPVATIPVVINAVQPPLPKPSRCYAFGQAFGRAVASFPGDLKVLIVGSGGLSHELGVFGKINESFDRLTMEKIVDDPSYLAALSNDEVVDLAGAQGLELMTWLAMRGAVSGPVNIVNSIYHAPISHTGGAMMLLEPETGA
ncbi:MAG: protocatechuate 3,4-dioxygenase [Alphaproteobacteria bacterium]|nr:MAG: protocatechuate 3,4-dioxygenase [Alphaproteobacteria bacterium]